LETDPEGPDESPRVVRGGSWWDPARLTRSAYRFRNGDLLRIGLLGLRFALRSKAESGEAERVLAGGARQGPAEPGRNFRPSAPPARNSPRPKASDTGAGPTPNDDPADDEASPRGFIDRFFGKRTKK
jgi:hypothetical protein